MSYDAAMQLVTDVITCANVYNLSVEKRPNEERDSSNIYIHAYSELSSYLRYLFIYYDLLVSDDDLKNIIDEIELIHYIKDCLLKQRRDELYKKEIFEEFYSLKLGNIAVVPRGGERGLKSPHLRSSLCARCVRSPRRGT